LAFRRQDGQVTYFNGHMPVFSHAETDIATFRMITSQFCVTGHVKQSDIIRAFGVTSIIHQRFVRLVLPHLGDAYSLARWIAASRADAEDIVQDASLRAFRAIANVAEGNSRAWLLTIVRNTAYTWLRNNRPSALMLVDDLGKLESEQVGTTNLDSGTPETALIAKTEAASLEAAIAELPPAYRETLVLRDVQGLGYREISQVTGVPIGTVMSRLARGRAQVIKTIGGNST
jgi:RNA polymerase sigma factor (sigma-70 family)